jgi:hypothetical protein
MMRNLYAANPQGLVGHQLMEIYAKSNSKQVK